MDKNIQINLIKICKIWKSEVNYLSKNHQNTYTNYDFGGYIIVIQIYFYLKSLIIMFITLKIVVFSYSI